MLIMPSGTPRGVPIPRLAQLRMRRALSQAMLAERAGVSRPTIARIEAGDSARFATIHKLAEALGVEPVDLINGDR